MLEEWRKENVDADYQITNQIQALDAQLRDCQQHISRIFDDSYWTKLYHEFDPNLGTKGTTIFDITLQCFIAADSCLDPTGTPQSVAIEKLQAKMLRLFLQSGANPTLICRNEGFGRWLNTFSKRLISCNDTKRMPPRIVELHTFLKCGLDINTILHGNITIWYRLLIAVHQSLQQTSRGKTHHQNLHRILFLCLKYDAESDAPGLPRIMTWMRDDRWVPTLS